MGVQVEQESSVEREVHPRRIRELVEVLSEPGGATCSVPAFTEKVMPAVVEPLQDHCLVVLDLADLPASCLADAESMALQLFGEHRARQVRTALLPVLSSDFADGRLTCRIAYPDYIETFTRRSVFRARLRKGRFLACRLRHPESARTVGGQLTDLSENGCRVHLPTAAARLLASGSKLYDLSLLFADGSSLELRTLWHHYAVDAATELLCVGFEFVDCGSEQRRMLYRCVRDIELESRGGDREASLSPLLSNMAPVPQLDREYLPATPAARLLEPVADFMGTQWLALQRGERFDSARLSRAADAVLSLLHRDRQATLLALYCLPRLAPLARHCLALAVRLADIAHQWGLPQPVVKGLAACALVHDAGKLIASPALALSVAPEDIQERFGEEHIARTLQGLESCHWIPQEAVSAVVEQSNKRLDGSGAPRGLAPEDMTELGHLAAVLDAAESLERGCQRHAPMPPDALQLHLLRQPGQFDHATLQACIQHFGRLPVGAVLRLSDGELVRISRLDAAGQPLEVIPVPDRQVLRVSGSDGLPPPVSASGLGTPAAVLATVFDD